MYRSMPVFRATVLILLICLAQAGPSTAREGLDSHGDCTHSDASKLDLCGHALAEIELIEAGISTSGPIVMAVQDDTDITHCFLDFEILTTTNPKSIAGTNTLDVISRTNGLTQMSLDLESNMTVEWVKVNGASATFTRPTNKITINLGTTFYWGQSFQVQVAYRGSPKSRADGFSMSFFSTQSNGTDLIAASLSQPFYARYWWPCKDNYVTNHDKFTMDMHVTVPGAMTVAANGLLQGVDNLSGNRKKFRWRENYPIITYLVAFAATNYTKITNYYNYPGGSMPVEFYIYPDQVTVSQPYLPDIVQAIATFSDINTYGQYPFINEKYGIAQFQWCCGMEHQTITSQGAYTSENRNIHELAHQWWGDNVTCATWHDIWLNEGFARYSEALWKERRPGGSYADGLAYLLSVKPASNSSGSVYRYDISTTSNIFSTTYAYNKAGWVVHMLRHVLGDQNFFSSLAAYRSIYEGGAADTDQFRAVCESVSGMDLGWFFNHWVYGVGMPYYRWGWEYVQIAGKDWLKLYIEQYQKSSVASFPAAILMPVEIVIDTGSATSARRIWNDAGSDGNTTTQWFFLPVDAPVSGVQFDPDIKILRGPTSDIGYVAGPPRLTAAMPGPGTSVPVHTGVSGIVLYFNEQVQPTGSEFTVTGSVSGPRSFTHQVSPDFTTVTLEFAKPLPNRQAWTVQVLDSLTGKLSSLALDGEISNPVNPAALPSGNGIAGGKASFVFSIPGFAPDLDRDNDVDADDLSLFVACQTGPGSGPPSSACAHVDFDKDSDVDQVDFGYFQRCMGEPDIMPPADCAGA